MSPPTESKPGKPEQIQLLDHDAQMVEQGRVLFAGACEFLMGAVKLEQIPTHEMVEIAFAGRSNVGKSSLLNAVVGRKALARTSNTPGRTQEINFFNLGDHLMIADLPGYGYAKAPKSSVQNWTRLVNSYLRGRQELRRVCLLIDSRHGIKKNDREIMEMLDTAAVVYQIVLTKADKVSKAATNKILDDIRALQKKHTALYPRIIATSSKSGMGLDQLRAELTSLSAQ